MKAVNVSGAGLQFARSAPVLFEHPKQDPAAQVQIGQHHDNEISDFSFKEIEIPSSSITR